MRRAIVLAVALAAAGGLAGWAVASLPLFSPPGQIDVFGYVASIMPKGKEYRLRFDPAFFLVGLTATVAAVEDGEIKPGEALPNDYHVRNPEHSLLTFRLPANAHVTILINLGTTRITVAELARRLRRRPSKSCGPDYLVKPCILGFWLRYSGDTAKALDQQYQP